MAMESFLFLREIFPNKTEDQIQNIIQIVDQENPHDSPDQKMENMFNLLCGETFPEDVRGTLNRDTEHFQEHALQENPANLIGWDDEDVIPGPSGYGSSNDPILNAHFNQLQSIFPDATSDFLWDYCLKRKGNFVLDEAIDDLTTEGYDKEVLDCNTIWERLKGALPGADPSYLKEKAQELVLKDQQFIDNFVDAAIENNDYPTMEDYLKKKKEQDTLNAYADKNFDYNKFLDIFPNPEETFTAPNRQNPLEGEDISEEDLILAKTFLYNKYPNIRKRHIDLVFKIQKKCLIKCCDHLDKIKKGLKVPRKEEDMPDSKNLSLLQEIAYLKHRKLIKRVIKYKDQTYRKFKEQAKLLNILETCPMCAEDELIPEECLVCPNGCVFCKDCVKKYVEVRMGDGHTTFPCCNNCNSDFGLHVLQLALPEHLFERLVLKIQSEEIKQANLDGLETCPFCDFASIPPDDSKIFKCENPECLKESCRLCRHESHIPKRCNEIEYDEDVRRRTFIENMMTEALARTCYKCNKKFVKSNGCNKMACTCGALMCYLCSQPIAGYDHFGTSKPCQLFTNDAQIDLNRVKERAERAKRELGNVEIKFDPTVGIEQFFPAA